MRNIIVCLSSVFVLAAGCGDQVCGLEPDPEPEEPNGYCEADEDCADSDFCLPEWCDGPCRPMNRCFLRVPEGDWCNRDEMCAEGLSCGQSDEFDSGECRAL